MVAFPAGHGAVDWGGGAFWLLAPAIATALGLSPAQVGLLFTMRTLGGNFAALPAGLVGDSIRRRGIFLLGTFWWVAASQMAASGVSGFWILGLLLAVSSAGAAAWHPVAMGTMVERMPGRRAFALAIHSVGGTAAEVVAPLSVGFMLAFMSWRQVLQISTIPALIMGLVFFRLSRLVPPPKRELLSRAEIWALLRVLLQPGILGMILVLALHNMSVIAFMSMMPLYLETVHGFSPGLTGVAFSTFVVTGTVLAPVVGRVSDRVGRKPIALVGIFGGGVCAWLVTIAPGTVALFAALMATGMLMLSVRIVLMAMALELVGGRETTVIGFLFTLGEAPAALATALAGLVGEIDLSLALILAAGLSLASGAAAAMHSFTPATAHTEAAS